MLHQHVKGADFFTGEGVMSKLILQADWDDHPLGPIEGWPQSLKIALGIILQSGYPMFIWWGPEFFMFHNDAYMPFLGKKHPHALGKRAPEVWKEIWLDVGPMAREVMKGKASYVENLTLFLERNGFPEESYWTFSYSPILNLNGEIGGLFCACSEETPKILQQRRLKTITDLSAISSGNTSVTSLLQHTISTLSENKQDIPFAGIYVIDEDSDNSATLYASFGLKSPSNILDPEINLEEKSALGWDFRNIASESEVQMREGLQQDFKELQTGDIPVNQAAIVPIAKTGENRIAGILVCGISPYLVFDKDYHDFIKLVATNISRAKADIRSHEITRERNRVLAEADEAKTIYLQKLKQSQEHLEAMILQAPLPIYILKGENLTFEIANKSYLDIVGKTTEELIGKPLLEAFPEAAEHEVVEKLNEVYKEGKPFEALEFPIRDESQKNSETYYFNFVYEPLRESNGRVSGIMVVAVDVTAQVKARMLLQEREEYFRNVANDVPVMIWMTDKAGAYTYLNNQWLAYTGQPSQEGLGRGWQKCLHSSDRPMAEEKLLLAIKEQKYFEITYRLKNRDGNYYWHISAGMPRYNNDGYFEGFTGAVVNIHERKVAEDALKQSENELRSAISATNLGTWTHYPPSGKLEFSERSKELFGLSGDAKMDFETFTKGIHPEDRTPTLEALGRTIESKSSAPCILEYRTIGIEDGKLRWLQASGQPYFDEQGEIEVFIGTLLDITQHKALEKQKDDFLAIASHELKTPVTSIKGYIQMIAEDFSEKNENDAVNQLRIVDKQVDKLILLINELLDVSKIEAGEIKLDKTVFDFDELLQEAVNSMQYVATEHTVEFSGSTGKSVYGDRNRIEQVIVNLISNGIKFSPGAGRIIVNAEVKDGDVLLSVQDFGVGIKPENCKKIFDRFYRDSNTSQWSTGLGLGLYISSDIINRHKGSIYVESEVEKGSTFYVTLPYQN